MGNVATPSNEAGSVLEVQDLLLKNGPKELFGPAQLQVRSGHFITLLGRNGTGKTTLLHTLAGLKQPIGGEVKIGNQPLRSVSAKTRAQKIGIVLSKSIPPEHMTVEELVSLGRIPHTAWSGDLHKEDYAIVHEAMEQMNCLTLSSRLLHTLSDGELQRVYIARALAQQTDVVLLDEPTTHLDLPGKMEVLHLLKKWSQDKGKAVILSTHEVQAAMKLSEEIWLIHNRELVQGPPQDPKIQYVIQDAFQLDSWK